MALTPQATDFPRWYQEVVAQAELAENGPARGTMVIRPYGYAIWERCQALLDARIKAAGADNAYFPLFIPMSFFEREAAHVDGFSPELAVVTHGGGEKLAEPLAVRPTSETVILDSFSRWIQSYRDLPLLLNQWGNVVRWELRTRLFLRSSEFLWQEGHTAHATPGDALESTLAFLEVYRRFMTDDLGLCTIVGEKTAAERFAGAERTFTCEGLMRDGKALQMGTSHAFGERFARPFDITYQTETGDVAYASTSSWGVSTRIVGALIMAHGDDAGLRLPPNVAPHEVVLLPLTEGPPLEHARAVAKELVATGHRIKVDTEFHAGFGRRAVGWELRGAPVRIEIGPRDIDAGTAVVARRDRPGKGAKETVPLDAVARRAIDVLDEVQAGLRADHEAFTEGQTLEPDSLADYTDRIEQGGIFRVGWCGKPECETQLGSATGASIRCLPFDTGRVGGRTCLVDGAPAEHVALVARAY